MESAQNGTTAYVSECRVDNEIFRYDYDRRSKIRKPSEVKCLSHGAR